MFISILCMMSGPYRVNVMTDVQIIERCIFIVLPVKIPLLWHVVHYFNISL